MGKRIIAAGHICIDITPVFPRETHCSAINELLVPGKLIHTENADVHTGGSVANTGLALKKLGSEVTLMGKVGDDAFGGMVRDILGSHGVSGLIVEKGSSTSYSVVLAVPGFDRIFLHHPGANDSFSGADIPDEALEGAAIFHFGYPPIMRKMYIDGGSELREILRRAKSLGAATSVDMAAVDPLSEAGCADWKAILGGILPYTDFFVPSFEELLFMLDRERYGELAGKGSDMTESLDMLRDVKPLADKCIELGCRAVLIKCGISGMYYRTSGAGDMALVGENLGLDASLWADKEGFQPCFRPDRVLSATGAGDASIAAFLTAVSLGKTPEKCVALAAAEGACAVTSYDALGGLRPLCELEERINSGWECI